MSRIFLRLFCASALAPIFLCPAQAQVTLGDTGNVARLVLVEGVLDFSVTPFPVAETITTDLIFATAPDVAIHETISDVGAQRFAEISVSTGIVRASASSSGLTPDTYVHAVSAGGGFRDTYMITTADPALEWVPISFRLYVDGKIRSSGGTNTYNRGGVATFFELATAPGGQQGGDQKTIYDFESGYIALSQPCSVSASQQTCSLYNHIATNSDTDLAHVFQFDAVVRANQAFTLEADMAAGAATLAADEWTTSDFFSTGIFGGIQIGAGASVTSQTAGGPLALINGVANYGSAFSALTRKYGSATPGIAAVPEPGVWAMLVLGLSAIGAMLRRPRAGAVALSG